jgi:pimeloyl-ACP methyl ester carboxylesterase
MAKPSIETDAPPMGRTYEVGGKRLLLHRSGTGGPAVVFLPGAGLIGLDYLNIQQEVAKTTTSVIYDRGGTGWSDSVALPRSAADTAEELRSLLAAADVPAPYILVGHSLGGAYARRFAQLFPKETAGLVMLDPAHEGYDTIPSRKLSAQIWDVLKMAPALINSGSSTARCSSGCWPPGRTPCARG